MTEQEATKMNGWTFEETVKIAENLMELEKNMFKWDVLRHLRDFAENFCEEIQQYRAIGTPEECRAAVEKQTVKKPIEPDEEYGTFKCPNCGGLIFTENRFETHKHCLLCGQKLDWSDEE